MFEEEIMGHGSWVIRNFKKSQNSELLTPNSSKGWKHERKDKNPA
jgi:hypothetical protein